MGFSTVYVGADLPVADWVTAVEARSAVGIVLAVPRPEDITPAQKIVDALRQERPQLVIGLGGSQQDAVEGGIHLGHSITVAVGEMVRRLRVPA